MGTMVPSMVGGGGIGLVGWVTVGSMNVSMEQRISPPNSRPVYVAIAQVVVVNKSAEQMPTKS